MSNDEKNFINYFISNENRTSLFKKICLINTILDSNLPKENKTLMINILELNNEHQKKLLEIIKEFN